MRQNNRDKILKTARKMFLLHGYNGISIRTISSKAKLTTGAVYFHFKNKKEIYKTICIEAIDILFFKFKEGIESKKNPQQKLLSTFDSYLSFFYENRDHYNLLMEYKSAYDSEDDEINEIALKLRKLLDIMALNIKAGVDGQVFRKIDAEKLALLLASIAEGMLHYKKFGIFEEVKISDNNFRQFMVDVIGNGILNK